jgi:hypothetical protein
MIDHPNRDKLAQLLRHLAAGRLTTGRFSDECEDWLLDSVDSDDAAIPNVLGLGPDVIRFRWPRWSRRLRGRHRLSDDTRRRIAIAVVFLHSDYEYEWPEDHSVSMGGDCALLATFLLLLVLGIFATIFYLLGQISPLAAGLCFALAVYVFYFSNIRIEKARAKWIEECREAGDLEVWPFYRSSDFDDAKRHPKLLAG